MVCALDTASLLRFYRAHGMVSCRSQTGQVMVARLDLPQGTLDLLILRALALEPKHGWAIGERISQISKGTLVVPSGSMYPALHRLERWGWIEATWGASDNNRKAKYYALTRLGRKQLEVETEAWRRLTSAVSLVLDKA